MAGTYYYRAERLHEVGRVLFEAAGSPPEEAGAVAGLLVAANRAGHDSHGIIRIPQYLGQLRQGNVVAGQHNHVVADRGAAVRVSAGYGYGQTAALEAMALAVARARKHHVAAVGVAEMNHAGRLADYVAMASRRGLLGLIFAASGGFNKLVAPFGGTERRLNTNPLAVGFPSTRDEPVVFDIATSAFAQGKFRHLIDAGREAPPDVLLDKEGRPTTNPADLYEGGAVLPFGGAQGYKGFVLNFAIEVLGGILTESGFMGHPKRQAGGNCMLIVVVDVDAFRPLADFQADLDGFIDYLKATHPQENAEVLYPGESSARTARERDRGGLPVPEATVQALQAELEHYGLPQDLAGMAERVEGA